MKKTILSLTLVSLLLACGASQDTSEQTAATEPAAETPAAPETVPALKSDTPKASEYATPQTQTRPQTIEWLDFETAVNRSEANPKHIFVDVYTDWCGWCKRMDATTFKDPRVVSYFNEHVYAVKMDAESKTPIAYKGHLYEYKQVNTKSGYNSLAISLLDSRMSFPSFVVLNKKSTKVGKIVGYQDPTKLITALSKYIK